MESGDLVAADRARRVDELLARDAGLGRQRRVLRQIAGQERLVLVGTFAAVVCVFQADHEHIEHNIRSPWRFLFSLS